jgi:Fe-S cluster biogenesis protein NfuA
LNWEIIMTHIINTVNQVVNPNDLAHTLDLGGDYINPYGKLVIPNDSTLLRQAVPISDAFFGLVTVTGNHEILNRIDLIHSGQTTMMTLNIAAGLVKKDNGFAWTDAKRAKVTDELQTYLRQNGRNVIDLKKLGTIQVAEPYQANNDTVKGLIRVFDKHAKPMAAKHGGSYEITDMQSKKPMFGGARRNVTVTIKPDGACASCLAFNVTYGQLHKKVNEDLEAQGSDFRFKPVEAAPRQQALVLRRK